MKKVSQAVILAGGLGTRLWPLNSKPKVLLKAANETILEHNLRQLKNLVKEVIIVEGYKKEYIRKLIGDSFEGLRIKYVLQEKQLGTGNAIKKAEPILKDKFLVLNGDDFYFQEDIKKCLSNFPCILTKKVSQPQNFGIILGNRGVVKKVIEKPKELIGDLANIGVYFLDKSIFRIEIERSERGEYEITDYLKSIIKNKLYYQIADNWLPISYPWNLLEANEFFLKKMKKKIIVGKGTLIKDGTHIEGPVLIGENCQIGPNSYIRPFTTIGDNCKIGQGVEIKNSIINKGAKISHLSYIGDSIIGENCNIGGGTISANLRFDESEIKVEVKGKLVDTQRKKLGCIMGNNTKTGINVSLMPGVLIGSNSWIYPHSVVFRNVNDNIVFRS